MDIVLIILCVVIIVMLAVLLMQIKNLYNKSGTKSPSIDFEIIKSKLDAINTDSCNSQSNLRSEVSNSITHNMKVLENRFGTFETNMKSQLSEIRGIMYEQLDKINTESIRLQGNLRREVLNSITENIKLLENRFGTLELNMKSQLSEMRETTNKQLVAIRDDNEKQLDKIRGTVDEKLQNTLESRITESFKIVSERLEQVYKGLGEMQGVAQGVGDLKRVLSNVKTRGILGEIQLGAILREILTTDQYDENVETVPKSKYRVEFAVKLPGAGDGSVIYLPIDSKFNGDMFVKLQDAYNTGDKEIIDAAKKELVRAVKKCAKDICDKYISPPYTTQFGIMFLPFEGLYAEIINSRGLVEELQKEYKVTVAGPSTMAAMLNSFKMGFQTLAIQKRSGEVWKILGSVRTEFEKFEKALSETQEHLNKTEQSLEKLVGVRTRQLNRKLNQIERFDPFKNES